MIIGEAAWVSTDWRAVRRAMILKAAALTGVLAFATAATAAWWTSYGHNKELIADTEKRIEAYRAAAGPLASEKIVSDRGVRKGRTAAATSCASCRPDMARAAQPVPWTATFGLGQHERLRSSSENVYRIALERMFRSRLIYRMEEVLEANRNTPGYLYEALKVYIMLGGLQPLDRELVIVMDAPRLGRQPLSRRRQCRRPQGAGRPPRRDARSRGGPGTADHPAWAADRGDAEDARAAQRRATRL